jgi:hypothetical protein
MEDILGLIVLALGAIIVGAALSTWLVTVLVGAGLQTLGIVGPGWETVLFFVLALRVSVMGTSTPTSE